MKKIYSGIVGAENAVSHLFLLAIRLYWGVLLVITGFGKWVHFSETASYFASLHIPVPLLGAFLCSTVEVLGGVSLILGLYCRISTLFLVVNFAAAYWFAYPDAFSSPTLFFSKDPFLYLYATLVVLFFGAGFFSLDALREKGVKR